MRANKQPSNSMGEMELRMRCHSQEEYRIALTGRLDVRTRPELIIPVTRASSQRR